MREKQSDAEGAQRYEFSRDAMGFVGCVATPELAEAFRAVAEGLHTHTAGELARYSAILEDMMHQAHSFALGQAAR